MERWAVGEAYESYVGRWSRPVARRFIDWLAIPPGSAWLDAGCGTGALSATALVHAHPRRVLGVDRSAGFLAHARTRLADPRAVFCAADIRALPVAAASFDVAVSGLVLNFVPGPERAVADLVRAVRPGGTVALYLWDYAGEMQLIRRFWDAALAVDPASAEQDEGRRFPICQPGPLTRLLQGSGLKTVEVMAIDVPTVFRDFEDYWQPFLGGQGPAPGYCSSLSAATRASLRAELERSLPREPDGSLHLMARAWAARGMV